MKFAHPTAFIPCHNALSPDSGDSSPPFKAEICLVPKSSASQENTSANTQKITITGLVLKDVKYA